MNESQNEPNRLPEYAFKPFETPKISQDVIEALNGAYESMWKSDFIAHDYKQDFKMTFGPFSKSSPCTEVRVTEKPKPGNLFIQLREGEEYATDHQESI